MQIPKILTVPVTENATQTIKTVSSFEEIMKQIFEENQNVLWYAKTLDAFSTGTFNHSANVAFHLYNFLSKDNRYSEDEVKEWTTAALVHDAGKLTTPIDILHSKEKFNDPAISNRNFEVMMRHSIDGYEVAKEYGFDKRSTFAIIAHHVDAKAIENGSQAGFKDATASRKTWEKSFGNGYVEQLLTEAGSWLTEKDKYAVEALTVIDAIEAMRSTERFYNQNKCIDWENISKYHGNDAEKGALNKSIVEKTSKSVTYQNEFNELQSYKPNRIVRHLVSEMAKDFVCNISKDKMEEIKNNPEYGEAFFKKNDKNGQFVIDLGNGEELVIPKKEDVPDLSAEVTIVNDEYEYE